jgi:aryl-alcohol dehydrogenase-like predicted oxidoreductase
MLFNNLPGSEIKVSRIGFGGAALSGEGKGYGFGPISEKEAINLIQSAIDSGINLIDTAPVYGFGLSEIRIGKALKSLSSKREDIIIIDKAGVTWAENKHIRIDNSPEVISRMLDQSLKDLNTDYIDYYLLHWPDPNTPLEESLGALLKEKEKGKIRHIGFSNPQPDDLRNAIAICQIEMVQGELSFLNPTYFENLKSQLTENNIAFTGWGTFDKGIITGTVTKDRKYPGSDARSWAPWWKNQNLDEKLQKIEGLKHQCEKTGRTLLEAALGFTLSEPGNHSSLCGFRSQEQLNTIIQAMNNLEARFGT